MDGEPICLPLEIKPDSISINDYDIKFDKTTRTITEIVNRKYGPVLFSARHIDDQLGFVSRSVIEVFTAAHGEDVLNVLHMHVNDMCDSVTVEVAHTKPGEDEKAQHVFSVDASG